jgi:hypothetical protein
VRRRICVEAVECGGDVRGGGGGGLRGLGGLIGLGFFIVPAEVNGPRLEIWAARLTFPRVSVCLALGEASLPLVPEKALGEFFCLNFFF